MALSLFIKQLLETDSIFGGEAKKLSGINDRSVVIAYTGVDVVSVSSLTELSLTITNSGPNFPTVPPWLIEDKYVLINVTAATVNPVTNTNNNIEADRQRVDSVSVLPNGYKVFFKLGERGSGILKDFTDLSVNLSLDGRIFAVINDTTIAREAENGSTMFNVDNSRSDGLEDGSGLVQKYASHYHSDVSFNLVSHTRNIAGNPLLEVGRIREGDLLTLFFNREEANRVRAQGIIDNGVPAEVSMTISSTGSSPGDRTRVEYIPSTGGIYRGVFGNDILTNPTTQAGLVFDDYRFENDGFNVLFSPGGVQSDTHSTGLLDFSGATAFITADSNITVTVNNYFNTTPSVGTTVLPAQVGTTGAQLRISLANNLAGALNGLSEFNEFYTASPNSPADGQVSFTSKGLSNDPRYNSITGQTGIIIQTDSPFLPVLDPATLNMVGGSTDGNLDGYTHIEPTLPVKTIPCMYAYEMAKAIRGSLSSVYTAKLSYFPDAYPGTAFPRPEQILASWSALTNQNSDFRVRIGDPVSLVMDETLLFRPLGNQNRTNEFISIFDFGNPTNPLSGFAKLQQLLVDNNLDDRLQVTLFGNNTLAITEVNRGSFDLPIRFEYIGDAVNGQVFDATPAWVDVRSNSLVESGVIPGRIFEQRERLFFDNLGEVPAPQASADSFSNLDELFTLLQESPVLRVARHPTNPLYLDINSRVIQDSANLIFVPPLSAAWQDGSVNPPVDLISPVSVGGDTSTVVEAGPQLVFDREGNAVFQNA